MESEKAANIIDLAGVLASRAEDFDQVLVLCRKKDGTGFCIDNEIEMTQKLFLCESYRLWLVAAHSGMIGPMSERS